MAGLRLRPIRDDELAAFLSRGEVGYRQQLVDFAGLPEAEARAKASRDYASVFPDGHPNLLAPPAAVSKAFDCFGSYAYGSKGRAKSYVGGIMPPSSFE